MKGYFEQYKAQNGHIVMESGNFSNKYGVAIIENCRWKNKINWVDCASERVIAASISVNRQPITVICTYMPHSGYPDHHIEKTYDTFKRVIGKDKRHENHRRRFQRRAWPMRRC